MTLTDEMKAVGWRDIGEIESIATQKGFYYIFLTRDGEEWGELCQNETIALAALEYSKQLMRDGYEVIAFRTLAPVIPNTITISDDDARVIIAFWDDLYQHSTRNEKSKKKDFDKVYDKINKQKSPTN
jgi:hypothetical protein